MYWVILILLLFVPLPYASVSPFWQWLWICYVGIVSLINLAGDRGKANRTVFALGKSPWVALPLFSVISFFSLTAFQIVNSAYFLGMDTGLSSIDPIGNSLPASVDGFKTTFFLASYASHLMWFFLVFSWANDPSRAFLVVRDIAIISVIYAIIGLYFYFFKGTDDFSRKVFIEQVGLSSTFVNRNNFAVYVGVGLIATMAWFTNCLSINIWRPQGSFESKSKFIHVAGWFGMFLLLQIISLFLTGSRAGIFVGFLAMTVFFLQIKPIWWRHKLRILPSVVLFFVGLAAYSGDLLWLRLSKVTFEESRFTLYPVLLESIEDRPFWGFGLGTFENVMAQYRSVDIELNFVRAHNEYLELTITAGLPIALLTFLGVLSLFFMLLPAVKTIRINRSAHFSFENGILTALGIAAFVLIGVDALVDFPMQIPAISYILVSIVSIGSAAALREAAKLRKK